MLSKYDDYPIHQTSYPLSQPATNDRNTYDRYWFNGYNEDGEFYFGIGAALYPNLGIMDCGFSLVIDGVQYAFHASRRAPLEPSDMSIGPFKLEILEPMMSLRVTIDDNDTGIAADLSWIPRTANMQEGHQFSKTARTVMQATRFNQFGYWQGEIRYAGKTLKVDAATTYGTKDRSWGVRPVGDHDPAGAPPQVLPQVFFLWAPLHWEHQVTHMGLFENAHSEIWHWDGLIMPTYNSPADIPGVEDPGSQPLAGVEYNLEYIKGTRRARRAEITLIERSGKRMEIELDAVLCYRMKGIGYQHPEWGHGFWKGELAIGGESWKVDEVDPLAFENQHIQQVVMASCSGEKGVGVLEQMCLGPHKSSGFTEILDPA